MLQRQDTRIEADQWSGLNLDFTKYPNLPVWAGDIWAETLMMKRPDPEGRTFWAGEQQVEGLGGRSMLVCLKHIRRRDG